MDSYFHTNVARFEDLPELADLLSQVERLNNGSRIFSKEKLSDQLNSTLTVMNRDTQVVRDSFGKIVGFSWTALLPSLESADRCYVNGGVHPDFRGEGVGRQLLLWSIEHSKTLLGTCSSSYGQVIRVSHDINDLRSARLFDRFGFYPIRWFEDLVRPLSDLPPLMKTSVFRVEMWPNDDSTIVELLELKNSAFKDHWSSTEWSLKRWSDYLKSKSSRLDLSLVAKDVATDQAVGFLLTFEEKYDGEIWGPSVAMIEKIATLRSWRRRGVATALICNALISYSRKGFAHSVIGVDSESPSGANRLYRSLGFKSLQQFVHSDLVLMKKST